MPGKGKQFGEGHKGGRPKGALNKATLAARELAANVLDERYMARLKDRVYAGKAPHMETLLWHYLHGRPRDLEAPHNTGLDAMLKAMEAMPEAMLQKFVQALRAASARDVTPELPGR